MESIIGRMVKGFTKKTMEHKYLTDRIMGDQHGLVLAKKHEDKRHTHGIRCKPLIFFLFFSRTSFFTSSHKNHDISFDFIHFNHNQIVDRTRSDVNQIHEWSNPFERTKYTTNLIQRVKIR